MNSQVTESQLTQTADPVSILEARFPEKAGRMRKLKHLWSEYWRVNIYDMEKQQIVESYFAKVDGNEVNITKN